MSDPRPVRDEDRLFVRKGRRSYRRSFSRAEVRWGVAVLASLMAITAWVAWKGAHPDPALYASGFEMVPGAVAPAGRAPFPADLAAAGWQEGAVTHFDSTNLYVKIDGREDYYKSFGFQHLHCLSLTSGGDSVATVDIELFDLGTAANALGAYAGERPPDATPHVDASGMWHRARNAMFMTVGRHYARLVGSDESEPVLAELEHVRRALAVALPAEPLPWGYALFVGGMQLDPGRVSYVLENAFSFGFARQVYTARLDDKDLEGFVVAAADPSAATQLAARFAAGFREYGEDAGQEQGVHWVRDRYLGTLAAARASGVWVLGVRGAADRAHGTEALAKLETAALALPEPTVARARAEAAAAPDASAGESEVPPSGEPGAPPSTNPGTQDREPGS